MKNKHKFSKFIGTLILLAGIGIAAYGLVNAVNPTTENVDFTMAFIGLGVFIVGFIWRAIATDLSRGICDKCGSKMTGCQYEYQEVSHDVTDKNDIYKVQIIAVCPNCGKVKKYITKFVVPFKENVQYHVDEYCRNLFGH